jgi:CSLREA domain-containing protein
MRSAKTTTKKTNHYFRALVALAVLASLLAVLATRPTHAATTFTVNTTGDGADTNPGDGTCSVLGSICSLRAAIQEANATPGADVINFNVGTAADGLATISPNSALPLITDRVTIDGYTQPGSSPNTLSQGTNAVLKVELSGANAGTNVSGLNIRDSFGDPSGSVVRGLAINRFSRSGIEIDLEDPLGSNGVDIQGNFIGTDPSGTIDRGNGIGVVIQSQDSVNNIGGNPDAHNLISGNDGDGLLITAPAGGATGKDIVIGNLIGTKKDGTGALGNSGSGLQINGSSGNFVRGNTIAFNGNSGVSIKAVSDINSANDNAILGNSIFSNVGLGIDLSGLGPSGPTPNDTGDADQGANTLQNFPVLTSAKTGGGKTTVKGKLNSRPNMDYLVQFFSNPSGGDEGKKSLGEKTVTTDGSGNVSFTFQPASKVAVGRTITATATLFEASHLNTSEFSTPRKVASS